MAKKSIKGNRMKPKILVIGDIMLDIFTSGDAHRLSPEAPVPIILNPETRTSLGGAGNVVVNLCALDCDVRLLSCIGDDDAGNQIREKLSRIKSCIDINLIVAKDHVTTTKQRFIANGQSVVRVDNESLFDIFPDIRCTNLTHQMPISYLNRMIEASDTIVVSDYGKGFITETFMAHVIASAGLNKIIVVDPKGKNTWKYAGASIITPNTKEAFDLTGESDPYKAGPVLQKRLPGAEVIITCGSIGMLLFSGGRVELFQGHNVNVSDTTGAGDTVVAVVTALKAMGTSTSEAARLANLAGSLVVSKHGTACVNWEDLSVPLGDANAKHS